jgi:hypothetical protein
MSARIAQLEERLDRLDRFIDGLHPASWAYSFWTKTRSKIFRVLKDELDNPNLIRLRVVQ